jgi:hypothetical protein
MVTAVPTRTTPRKIQARGQRIVPAGTNSVTAKKKVLKTIPAICLKRSIGANVRSYIKPFLPAIFKFGSASRCAMLGPG